MKTVRWLVLLAVVLATLCALPTPELRAAPGGTPLFGTDAFNGNLITINPSTGVGNVVGPLGVGPSPPSQWILSQAFSTRAGVAGFHAFTR